MVEPADVVDVLRGLTDALEGMKVERVPPPAPFTGAGSIDDFFAAFEKYAGSVYKYDTKSYLQILPTFLEGEAKAIVQSFGTGTGVKYGDVKRRVVQEISARDRIGSNTLTDLFAVRRGVGESLTCYSIRLEMAASKIDCVPVEGQKVMVHTKFLSVLSQHLLDQLTVQLGHLENVGLERIVRLATILENQNPAWSENRIVAAPAVYEP